MNGTRVVATFPGLGRYESKSGIVVQWEPLGLGMCDCLVRADDGDECWFASTSLLGDDGRTFYDVRADLLIAQIAISTMTLHGQTSTI